MTNTEYGIYNLMENDWAHWHEGIEQLDQEEHEAIVTNKDRIYKEFTIYLKELYLDDREIDEHIKNKEKYISDSEGEKYLWNLFGYKIKEVKKLIK